LGNPEPFSGSGLSFDYLNLFVIWNFFLITMPKNSFEKIKISKVEGEEKKPEREKKEKKKEKEKELKPWIEKMQKFLESKRDVFNTFAQDTSLKYIANTGFYIDFKKGEIHSDVLWFKEKFNPEEIENMIEWAHFHELSHFLEYAESPEVFFENFAYIEKKAKQLAPKVLEIWRKKAGGDLPDYLKKEIKIPKKEGKVEKMTVGEKLAQDIIYRALHRFYNIFDDIAVNSLIRRRTFKFEENSEGDDLVKRLYREKLFPGTDFSKRPLHLQLIDPYLREEMVPEEKIKVSSEIEKIRKKISYLGEDYSEIKKFNQELIKRSEPEERYSRLKRILEPIYLDLLFKDLEKEPLPSPPRKGGGVREEVGDFPIPFEKDYKDYENNSPDQFSEEDIENWIKKKKEEKEKKEEERRKKEEEDRKSFEEKEKEIQEKMDKEWCKRHNIEYSLLQKVRRIEKEIEPYLKEMSQFWRKIVFGYSTERKLEWEGYYKFGTRLDIQKVIKEWPKIEKGDVFDVKVMKKRVVKEKLTHQPEVIRVRLVLDVSGSMNEEKLKTLREITVLLGRSLQEFNNYLSMARETTGTKLVADLEEWIFESKPQKIKPLAGDDYRTRNWEKDKADFIKSIGYLFSTGGSTADFLALKEIEKTITEFDIERIKQGKLLEILIEITDGGSDNPKLTREVKNSLKEKGIIAKAFQIGEPSKREIEAFKTAWENDGDGERVPELSQVLPTLTQFLKKYLKDVKL